MRLIGFVLGLLLLSLGAAASAQPPAADTGDVIILFRDGVDVAQREHVLKQSGAEPKRHYQHVSASVARASANVRGLLERHPDVMAVVPDRPVRKQGKPTGGSTSTSPQVTPAGVLRIGAAPGLLSYTGSAIGVAVVDTGIDFNHADLTVSPTCHTEYTASCQDDDGHGTHVSGIIAAKNNTVDVVGVAPDATLYAVKVLDHRGNGTDSAVMGGLDWVAQNAASVTPRIRVVNMSLGRPGSLDDNPALHAAVRALYQAGITVVVAAGNDPALQVSQQVPATYPEAFAIASTTAKQGSGSCTMHPTAILADTASYFTSDGRYDAVTGIGVTVSAPGEEGENIARRCFLQSVGIQSTRLGGGTTRMAGTSMAAPHVAGVVALMVQEFPTLTPDDARGRLRFGVISPGVAPLDSPSASYSFDSEREGVVSALGSL